MLKYLLATNSVIYVIKRRPIEVLGIFNEHAGRMAISAVTLSELFHGAEMSAKVAQNLAVVEKQSVRTKQSRKQHPANLLTMRRGDSATGP